MKYIFLLGADGIVCFPGRIRICIGHKLEAVIIQSSITIPVIIMGRGVLK